MLDFNFTPEVVDRDDELKELDTHLKRTLKGKGSILFVSGEAGIGKTRLVDEVKKIAQSKGFKVLSGNSMFESFTPYLPLREALRSGELDSLLMEQAPRVESVFLVTDTGLLIKDVMREETELDTNIFASMLSAVSIFVMDSLSMLSGEEVEGALKSLGYEDYQILIERGVNANLVVILTGKENEFLINDMREILVNVNRNHGVALRDWDGDDKSVEGIDKLLEPLISSGKYDGIEYKDDDPKAMRNVLFENVSLGLKRQSNISPLLICIEDLQWADPSTLALMHYIARNTRKCSLLLLGTYRPEDITAKEGKGHPLIEIMQLMNLEDLYSKIELQRLSEKSITEILSSILGEIDFDEEFKKRIYKETEGNPLFIIELTKLMVEEGTIQIDNGVWRLSKSLEHVNIPSKIHDVIVRRLDRLDEEQREVLDCASVIGEEFTSELLSNTLDLSRMKMLKILRTLEQRHRLIHFLRDDYKFDHVKIKEVLYNEISQELRMEYHAIIAESIEKMYKENPQDIIEELAFHYPRCRNKERALPYLIKAAEKATKHFAFDEALQYYIQALHVVEVLDDTIENKKVMLQILIALGESCYFTGDWEDSLNYYKKATTLSEELGDEKSIAKCFKHIGFIYLNRNEWEHATLHLEKGLEISKKIDDYQMIADIYYDLGTVFERKGQLNEAQKNFEKCMDIATKIEDHSKIAEAFLGIGRLHAQKSAYHDSIEAFKKAIDILERSKNLGELSRAYANLGATYIFVDLDEAIKYHNKTIEIAEKTKNIRIKGYSLMNTAYVLIQKNELQRASDYLDKALEIFERLQERMSISTAYISYGLIHRRQKEWDKAMEYFEKAIIISKELNTPYNLGNALFEYGLLQKDRGNIVAAKDRLKLALTIFKDLQNVEMIEKVEKELSFLTG